jgi:hypothetical protein
VQDGATDVISLSYAYGDGPNLQANDGINLTGITDNVTPANTLSLWYTGLGRLQNANGPWGSATFTHDGVGNRTSEQTVTNDVPAVTTTKVLAYPPGSNRVASEIA